MKGLRHLPEEWINADLQDLLRVSAELKNSIQKFGSDSVMTAVVKSDLAYDIQVNSIGFNDRVVEVTYRPSDTTFEGQGTILRFSFNDSYQNPANTAQVLIDELPPAADGTQKFRLHLRGGYSTPLLWGRYKFYFETIGSGTFTATLI